MRLHLRARWRRHWHAVRHLHRQVTLTRGSEVLLLACDCGVEFYRHPKCQFDAKGR